MKSRIKAAIIRGASLNKWEMQNFEPLVGHVDVVACGAEEGMYPTDGVRLTVQSFKVASSAFDRLGLVGRIGRRIGAMSRPEDELIGLEDFLAGYDVAHAAETHIAFSEQAVRAKLRHGVRVALTCWETIPFAYEEDDVIRRRRQFVREHADLFLATTDRAANALRLEGVDSSRVRVIRPGVDVGRFAPGPRDSELCQRFALADDDIVILFVGRLIGEKGVRELVLAMSLVLRSVPPAVAARCRLLIAGSGPRRTFIEGLIESLGLRAHAKIVGGMDYMELHRLHRTADVFVLPSISTPTWEEQFGMVLAEAMACGRPVVSTTSGAIPEVVGDGGLIVPPLEPEALADAVRRLVVDEELRRDVGRKARWRAEAEYDAVKVAYKLESAYVELIGQTAARGGVARSPIGA
jgi:glycosyltransferase involved in cell wall biosynthesis